MIKKVIFSGLILVLLCTPLILFVLHKPLVSTQLPILFHQGVNNQTSDRYKVQSEVSGYTVALSSTGYLDYESAKLGIFGPQAIADPKTFKFPGLAKRYTVTTVQFVLRKNPPVVPVVVVTGDGKTVPMKVVGQGEYQVINNVLVVSIWLDISSLIGSVVGKYALDDTFVRTALYTLSYARGNTDARAYHTIVDIATDIQANLYSGLFLWPLQIVSQ